jgi:hypothetical protein
MSALEGRTDMQRKRGHFRLVGSLLLWRTHERLLAERNIGEFSLPATDDMDPTDYVLDGQQRLTVIYSCLGARESDGGFSVVYDLESKNPS